MMRTFILLRAGPFATRMNKQVFKALFRVYAYSERFVLCTVMTVEKWNICTHVAFMYLPVAKMRLGGGGSPITHRKLHSQFDPLAAV